MSKYALAAPFIVFVLAGIYMCIDMVRYERQNGWSSEPGYFHAHFSFFLIQVIVSAWMLYIVLTQ